LLVRHEAASSALDGGDGFGFDSSIGGGKASPIGPCRPPWIGWGFVSLFFTGTDSSVVGTMFDGGGGAPGISNALTGSSIPDPPGIGSRIASVPGPCVSGAIESGTTRSGAPDGFPNGGKASSEPFASPVKTPLRALSDSAKAAFKSPSSSPDDSSSHALFVSSRFFSRRFSFFSCAFVLLAAAGWAKGLSGLGEDDAIGRLLDPGTTLGRLACWRDDRKTPMSS
jgi:hypothetical protein